MRIVNRYILNELGGPFLVSLLVLTVILAMGNIMQTVDMVMNKGVDIGNVVKIFLFFLPYVLIFTIPISVLAAVLLGFGRLSGDNEVTALRTSGISIFKLVLPVVICGIIISLISLPLNDRILPQAEFEARKLLKSIGIKNPTALLEPGVFVKGFKDYIIFVHGVKDNTLEDIRIYQPREGKATRTIIAKTGRVISLPAENSVKLHLSNGMADEVSSENPNEFYKLSFRDYYITLNLDSKVDVNKIEKKAREKSIKEIMGDIHELSKNSINVIPLKVELHKKIAMAFSNIVFVVIGIPLAITTHRREKFIGLGLAIVLFLVYWGIMLSGIAFAIRGLIPPWIGVWSADVFLMALGLVLFYRITRA